MMKTNYIDKGIPVIIGEYGCPTVNKDPDSVRLFLSSVCKAAYERDMCPVLWSTPGGHYNRDTCKMEDQELKKLFNEICDSSDKEPEPPVENTVIGDVNNDGEYTVADIVLLSNWLLNAEKSLANGKAADFNEDGIIDVFDLCLARYQLVKVSSR